jgi:hypothetical protein
MTKNIQTVAQWDPTEIKFTQPKINDKGGKFISVLNSKTHKPLSISTPLMTSWGISDYTDANGESDGKYSISLNFPAQDFSNKSCDEFLAKMKSFEATIINLAVINSEAWFGEKRSHEILSMLYTPILKYGKDKTTKKTDYNKPPSIRAKVSNYDEKWDRLEIYDPEMKLLFPCSTNTSPIDFVPKLSNVAAVLNFSQIWIISGKNWGCSIKLVQCVVKASTQQISGICHLELTSDDRDVLNQQNEDISSLPQIKSDPTQVDDSDEEEEEEEKMEIDVPSLPVIVTAAVKEPIKEKKNNLKRKIEK